MRTPVQAPNANAVAERWIRSVREECLDKLLMWDTYCTSFQTVWKCWLRTRYIQPFRAFYTRGVSSESAAGCVGAPACPARQSAPA